MPGATPIDVRIEIDTDLDDPQIAALLRRIKREWQREYRATVFEDDQHVADFEAALTALRIAEGRDRRAETVQSGRTSTTYEASEIKALQKRVRRLDPGDTFGHSATLRRDMDRYVTSATPGKDA
jgi:hypothetical protein